jgi:hypothetical protein
MEQRNADLKRERSAAFTSVPLRGGTSGALILHLSGQVLFFHGHKDDIRDHKATNETAYPRTLKRNEQTYTN